MHIVARARQVVEALPALLRRTEEERRRCPVCDSAHVHRHDTDARHPISLHGRLTIAVPRYHCQACRATHSPEHPDLLPGAHYSRSVRRCAIDQWLRWVQRHTGSPLRRVAEWLRAVIGHQERWGLWHPVRDSWDPAEERASCTLSARMVCYWLDQAGVEGMSISRCQITFTSPGRSRPCSQANTCFVKSLSR